MPGGIGLRPQYAVEFVVGERFDEAARDHGRRVHDGGQGPFPGDAVHQVGQRGPVGCVAGRDGHLGAERGEFFAQRVGALGVGAPAAGQQQVAYAVDGDEVAGDQAAERARATGDQRGTVRIERRRAPTAAAPSPGLSAGTCARRGTSTSWAPSPPARRAS